MSQRANTTIKRKKLLHLRLLYDLAMIAALCGPYHYHNLLPTGALIHVSYYILFMCDMENMCDMIRQDFRTRTRSIRT